MFVTKNNSQDSVKVVEKIKNWLFVPMSLDLVSEQVNIRFVSISRGCTLLLTVMKTKIRLSAYQIQVMASKKFVFL